jgi:hypothetical protein
MQDSARITAAALLFVVVVVLFAACIRMGSDLATANDQAVKNARLYYEEKDRWIHWTDDGGGTLKLTFMRQDSSLFYLKGKRLTWEQFKQMPKDGLVIDRFEGDARGVGVLVLSPRDTSEVLPAPDAK